MANQAAIWYWPNDGTKAVKIPFGARFTMRQGPSSRYVWVNARSMTGEIVTTQQYGVESIQIEHKWGSSTAGRLLRRQLEGLINHLERGGYCAIAEVEDYAFAAFNTKLIFSADTQVRYSQNLFIHLVAIEPDIDGREVDILSDPEHHQKVMGLVSTHDTAAKAMTLSAATETDFDWLPYSYVREHGTFPAMRIPEELRNGNHITTDRENVFFLDLPLETDPVAIYDLKVSDQPFPGTGGGNAIPPKGPFLDGPLSWWNQGAKRGVR